MKILKPKAGLWKTDKIDKAIAKIIKKKKENTQMLQIRNERRNIVMDPVCIQEHCH